ncbi:MAG: Gfo/Idh/MocA family oxidoreductase [Elusimicrobia bacterium]|nr:Gfo/Idh/MocA family oxidoreductase [Elusimicrobiota bacterium]
MADKKLKFGVIGCGKIGTFHARTLAKMPQVELVGVCDILPMRAQMLAWRHNCVAYKRYTDLLPQLDAVIVGVPTELHGEVGLAAIERGVHSFVEKPIAATMDEAKQLTEAAGRKKVVLQVGHLERFNPAVTETFKHVKNPRYITIQRLGPFDPARHDSIGVVVDLMIHDIDLLLTMVDEPVVSFEAVGVSLVSGYEDLANVRLRFKNGCIADVTASRISFEKARNMRIYQDSSYISVDFMNPQIKIYRKKQPSVRSLSDVEVAYPKLERQLPMTLELEHFIDCIHNNCSPWPSGEKGSYALNLALRITEEMKKYDLSRADNPQPPGPIQMVSDFGKATQVILDQTLQNIGIDKQ